MVSNLQKRQLHFDNRDDFVEFRMYAHGRTRKSPYDAVTAEQAVQMLKG